MATGSATPPSTTRRPSRLSPAASSLGTRLETRRLVGERISGTLLPLPKHPSAIPVASREPRWRSCTFPFLMLLVNRSGSCVGSTRLRSSPTRARMSHSTYGAGTSASGAWRDKSGRSSRANIHSILELAVGTSKRRPLCPSRSRRDFPSKNQIIERYRVAQDQMHEISSDKMNAWQEKEKEGSL